MISSALMSFSVCASLPRLNKSSPLEALIAVRVWIALIVKRSSPARLSISTASTPRCRICICELPLAVSCPVRPATGVMVSSTKVSAWSVAVITRRSLAPALSAISTTAWLPAGTVTR